MSAYEKVKGGKLSFKSGASAGEKEISKKKKKKKSREAEQTQSEAGAGAGAGAEDPAATTLKSSAEGGYELDTGIGHAPDGKKSKKYEELFPVETKRFGYDATAALDASTTREAALDARVKKKADRYCK